MMKEKFCSICKASVSLPAEYGHPPKGYVFCSRQCLFIYQRNGVVTPENLEPKK